MRPTALRVQTEPIFCPGRLQRADLLADDVPERDAARREQGGDVHRVVGAAVEGAGAVADSVQAVDGVEVGASTRPWPSSC